MEGEENFKKIKITWILQQNPIEIQWRKLQQKEGTQSDRLKAEMFFEETKDALGKRELCFYDLHCLSSW